MNYARTYPSPPSGISLTSDVETLYQRYTGYRRGREPLASTAYFCLTVLEALANHVTVQKSERKSSKKRRRAAAMYNISEEVLGEIGRLSSTKGGPMGARKKEGSDPALVLSTEERHFLGKALNKLIRRTAEKANNPNKSLPEISLSGLPPMTQEGGTR